MSDAKQKAQTEAERRYPFDAPDPYRSDSDSLIRSVFVQGQRAGWIDHADAAKADPPDLHGLAQHFANRRVKGVALNPNENDYAEADAVLALFRGEEPK